MAAATFEKSPEECGDGSVYRKQMKMIVLAIMYGMGKYSLAEILKIDAEEAQEMIDDFFKAYPEVDQWIQANEKEVIENRFVETLWGYRRRFKHVDFSVLKKRWSPSIREARGAAAGALRQTTNAKIQGGAANQTKQVMVELVKVLEGLNEARGTNLFQIVAQVHDELLFYVPEDVTPNELEAIENAMIYTVKLSVPSKTDLALGKYWGMMEAVDYKGREEVLISYEDGSLKALSEVNW